MNEYERELIKEILYELDGLTKGEESPQKTRIFKIAEILLKEPEPKAQAPVKN